MRAFETLAEKQPLLCAALRWLALFLSLLTGITTHAQPSTAEQCRRQYANHHAAQLQCARRANTAPAPNAPLLTSPLANTQLIFGFFDRRFPGFNGGKEHLGVDLSAPPGAPVVALCDGTVTANNTRQADIVGAVLIIEHDCPQPLGTVYAYYGHVQSDLLPGDPIAAGGALGNVRDWGGNSHLHLGLSTRLIEENWRWCRAGRQCRHSWPTAG